MKRIAAMSAVLFIFLSMIGVGQAEEGAKEGATYIVGIKTWTNNWRRQGPGLGTMESNSNTLVGWEAEATWSNGFFLDASYLMSVPYTYYIFDQTKPASERERTDFDLAIGKQFHSHMAYFLGFRSTQIRERDTNHKETVAGPYFGVRGTISLSNAVSLFGKFFYLPLSERKVDTGSKSSEWATGWFAAAGIKYGFTRRLSASLGYQREVTEGENTDIRDTFAGPTFDMMYVF